MQDKGYGAGGVEVDGNGENSEGGDGVREVDILVV